MRHRYDTRALVVARTPLGEANALVTLVAPVLGLVRARAQGVRASGAKLAPALTTFTESQVILVRGKEGWRIAGAVLEERWLTRLTNAQARAAAARVIGLLVRLVADESHDVQLFPIIYGLFTALESLDEELLEAAEILSALRILAALGLDAGELPGDSSDFTAATLASVKGNRLEYIKRVNVGITASDL